MSRLWELMEMRDMFDAARTGSARGHQPRRVFLSSTSDLHRFPRGHSFVAAAQDAVTRAGDVTVDMAYFTARDASPSEYSARMVASTDVYVGIVGHRYGSPVHSRPGQSYIELEFETATELGLPRLIFLLAERDQLRLPAAVLHDPEHGERQVAFRGRLQGEAGLTVAFVRTAQELETKLYQALVELGQTAAAPPPPRELPPDVYAFTGRHRELEALDDLAAMVGQSPSAVVISAVSGTAGVGKTALAVHWAHRAAGQFPDGQLYVDLRGYDPVEALPSTEALARLLRSLGVSNAGIPEDLAERAARFRSLMAGRHSLIVLDNAREAEQVWPLLPGESSCLVVVTSRDSLAPLVVRHGARRIDLDRLPPDDAVQLLRTLVGPQVDDEPAGACELAEQCALLPLALRIAAELVASQPTLKLADLVAQLADERRRLDVLGAGDDPRTAVRAVFSWSYRQLPDEAARLFRLLGLHPGSDLDVRAAAALAQTDLDEAVRLVNVLTRAHLVESTGPSRVGMHDLLRAYARERAAEETETHRRAALTRLFDHYVDTSAAAMDTIAPADRIRHRRTGTDGGLPPPLATAEDARIWLDAERSNLVAAVAHMAGHGWTRHTDFLARTLWRYLDNGAFYSEALTVHRHALHAARESGDSAAAGTALNGLGSVYWRLGRPQEALEHLRQALPLRCQVGDREGEAETRTYIGLACQQLGHYEESIDSLGEALRIGREVGDLAALARSLGNLGVGLYWAARYDEASACFGQALRIRREQGERKSEAYAMGNLGAVLCRVGRYQEAIEQSRQALVILRELHDRVAESGVLGNLGVVHLRQGRYEEALYHLQQTLGILREVGGDQVMQAEALDCLGLVHRRLGRLDVAVAYHQQALRIVREVGNRQLEATGLNGLAEALRADGQLDSALAQHETALSLASDGGNRYERARALDGIADLLHAAGRGRDARERWLEAATVYAELGVPEATEVQRRLAELDQSEA